MRAGCCFDTVCGTSLIEIETKSSCFRSSRCIADKMDRSEKVLTNFLRDLKRYGSFPENHMSDGAVYRESSHRARGKVKQRSRALKNNRRYLCGHDSAVQAAE